MDSYIESKDFAMKKIQFFTDKYGYKFLEIDDKNNIIDNSGWSNKTLGYLKEDGIYVDSGLVSQKKVASLDHRGNVYSEDGKGLLYLGDKIASFDVEGNIYDENNRFVGRVIFDSEVANSTPELEKKVDGVSKQEPEPPEPDPSLGLIALLVVIVIGLLVVLAVPTTWNTLAATIMDERLYELIPFLIPLLITLVIGSLIVGSSNEDPTFGDIASTLAGLYFFGYLVQIIIHLVIVGFAGELTIGNFFMLLFGLLVANVGVCIPLVLLQSAILLAMNASRRN